MPTLKELNNMLSRNPKPTNIIREPDPSTLKLPGTTPSAPSPRKMREMKRKLRQKERAAKRTARQQARQERNTTRRMQRDAMKSATTGAQRRRLRGQHRLQNKMGPGVGGFSAGGAVTKNAIGHNDYRKSGYTLSTVDNRKKK